MGATFEIKMSPGLLQKLKELPGRIEKKVVRQGLRAAAKVVLPAVVAKAPRDTGFLASHIKVAAAPRSRKWFGVMIVGAPTTYRGETYYAAFVEYGHRIGKRTREIKAGQRALLQAKRKGLKEAAALIETALSVADTRATVPPHPFFRPAFDMMRERATKAAVQTIEEGIAREAAAIGMKGGKA